MVLALDFLEKISVDNCDEFKKNQTILSFEQYIGKVIEHPNIHIKNSAKYFADLIDYFGSYDINSPTGKLKRFKLFDADFALGEGKIFGQEKVQEYIVNFINNFVSLGKVDKFILLHGPNGSAKTSMLAMLARASEIYSRSEEGALYHFSWIFPKKDINQGTFGFNNTRENIDKTYAFLSGDDIDAQIRCDQHEHPLLLLSLEDRNKLWKKIDKNIKVPENLKNGELSHKNRQIFDALLSSYQGDLLSVFRHIRVERFYLSRKYRVGLSVIEPQLSVDAGLRQITADQSALELPAALRHLSLLEIFGPLVESNRGFVEYSDLLKRPIDAWKYLLVASEQAQVSVSSICLTFDLLMLATSNELHLTSFREYPDWPSFKGRMELVKVPYLLKLSDEIGIYKNQIPKSLPGQHIAPHAIEIAARFAVLTRLEAPVVQKYQPDLQKIILELTPNEKLELYDKGLIPARLSQKEAKALKSQIATLFNEFQNEVIYEGRYGASPREIRVLLLNAAQDKGFDHLSVKSVFKHLEELIEQKSSYEFLRRTPERGFKDANHLLILTKNHYRLILEEEIRNALGLYSKESYLDLFKRYIIHISSWIKKESFVDPLLQKKIDPDEKFMLSVEKSLLALGEDYEDFRKQLIGQIGAYRLENPQNEIDYDLLFCSHLKKLREVLYEEQYSLIKRIMKTFMSLEERSASEFDDRDLAYALKLKEGLFKLGYNQSSAWACVSYLLSYEKPVEKEISQQTILPF